MAYCTRSDIEARFGVTNVATWADLDNDEDPAKIAAAIADAIEMADAEIDDTLRGGPYTIPFASTPTTIKQVSRTLAGVLLYDSRGVADQGESPMHRLERLRKDARMVLRRILAGQVHLVAAEVDDQGAPAPEPIEDAN